MHPPASVSTKDDLRLAVLLGIAAALSVIAVMPYMMQLMPQTFVHLPVSLGALIGIQAGQALVLIGALSFAGLRMGHRVALEAPLLQHAINRHPLPSVALHPLRAITLGVAMGTLIVGLAALTDRALPAPLHPVAVAHGLPWRGLLASFYGGIVEEVLMRLFLMAAVVRLMTRGQSGTPSPLAYWLAIGVAALLFAAGHLPAAHAIWGLDAIVIGRTLLLNALPALLFGWLYWKRGLEMAMLAHLSADIVLHVLAPLLVKASSF